MINRVLANIEKRMQLAAEGLRTELAVIRTGRASPALVSHIRVDYAGALMPLNQLSSISVPEARLIVIQPWDKGNTQNIIKAIQKSELGLTPTSDGNLIRLSIPPLTEERRQELIKLVRRRVEERRVALRNLRHDALNELKGMEKNKEISQDESKRALDQLQRLTDRAIAEAEKIGQDKESELAEL